MIDREQLQYKWKFFNKNPFFSLHVALASHCYCLIAMISTHLIRDMLKA
ncbi:MAG: hypothetical protein JSR46_05010 [Verrucomicrobia bacterium]|nr:hypothetical protein [Verrucomicrobiota bacterium]